MGLVVRVAAGSQSPSAIIFYHFRPTGSTDDLDWLAALDFELPGLRDGEPDRYRLSDCTDEDGVLLAFSPCDFRTDDAYQDPDREDVLDALADLHDASAA